MRKRTIQAKPQAQESTSDLSILVVDDDPVIRRLLEQRLGQFGFQVTTANDGMEAARLLGESHFDVVLTDMMMPGDIDGLDLLRISKRESLGTEVILMTAHSSVETAVRAMKDGAGDYLEKPINFDELQLRLDKVRAVKSLLRNADDLRTAMDTTEVQAAQTIQRLEMELARQRALWHSLQAILHNSAMDEERRLEQAVDFIEKNCII